MWYNRSMSKNCSIDGCGKVPRARGWCQAHYTRWRRTGSPTKVHKVCSVPDCGKPYRAKNFCAAHYYASRTCGGNRPRVKRVEGDTRKRKNGYTAMKCPSHPNTRKDGWILEHVVVMSEMLGRPLLPGENVHHKNGVRDDNRPENLELWVTSQPAGQRPDDLLTWAEEIITRYG